MQTRSTLLFFVFALFLLLTSTQAETFNEMMFDDNDPVDDDDSYDGGMVDEHEDAIAALSKYSREQFEKFYSKKHALVIGIGDYDDPVEFEPLNVHKNSRELGEALLKYQHFDNVTILENKNATRAKILSALKEKAAIVGENDLFVFSFAGHNNETDDGYIVPQDAVLDMHRERSISFEQLFAEMLQFKAKHILLLVDACFAGMAQRQLNRDPRFAQWCNVTTASFESQDNTSKLYDQKVIQYMGSAASSQNAIEVAGYTEFAYFFIQTMRGSAVVEEFVQRQPFLRVQDIHPYISRKVHSTHKAQTPIMFKLCGEGEVLFRRQSEPAT